MVANGKGELLPNETILSDDTLDKLERLNCLKEKDAITDQEFNELKAKLM
ncbi:hypothetical protein [Gilliamella sp. ESL0250]|nr:hypothetical protein [Gilliamella sp. ESL0250]NUF49597.1 hypothetical protein [Gilliamella sp. ESL0250]